MNNKGLLLKEYKVCLMLLKIMPVAMAFLMFLNVLLILFDYKFILFQSIAGSSILSAILLYKIICVFKFCILHKLFLLYTMLTNIVLIIPMNDVVYQLLFIFGTILFSMLPFKLIKL